MKRRSHYAHDAWMRVEFEVPPLTEDGDYDYPEIQIAFSFEPGAEPVIDYVNGGDPGYGPEIEFISAKLIGECNRTYTQAEIDKLAMDYLASDAGIERATEEATL
jgi:hypothetical protein